MAVLPMVALPSFGAGAVLRAGAVPTNLPRKRGKSGF